MSRADLISRGEKVYAEAPYLNCRLFVQLLLNNPRFESSQQVHEGDQREGDIFQYGDNPGRHYGIYLGNNEVLNVEEWGAKPTVTTMEALAEEYGPIDFIYRPTGKVAARKLVAGKWRPSSDSIREELTIWIPWLWTTTEQIIPLDEIIKQTKELFPDQVDMPIPSDAEFTEAIKGALQDLQTQHEVEQVPYAYRRVASLRPMFRFTGRLKKSGYNLAPEFQALEDKYNAMDGVQVLISQSRFDKILYLNEIIIRDKKQGTGSAFMEEFVRLADEGGYTIFLSPDTAFGATSVSRLRTFYGRFGFKRNMTRNKDFRSQHSMVRQPRTVAKKAAVEYERFVTRIATSAGAAMFGDKLVLYHGTRKASEVVASHAFGRGTLFLPTPVAALPVATGSKLAGKATVLAVLVDPSTVMVGGTNERPHFIASTRIPVVLAGTRDPYDRDWEDETGPYPDDRGEPCVETEGKENPLSVGGQGHTAASRKFYKIQRDERGLFIDVDGKILRRYKGPAYRPDPFVAGVAVQVAPSFMGPDYRMVKLTAAFEAWKIDKPEAKTPAPKKEPKKVPVPGALFDIDKFSKKGSETLYHGRNNDRPYNGDYIFLTPDIEYARGYSRGPNGLFSYRLKVPTASIFSMKRESDRRELAAAMDPKIWRHLEKSTPRGEEIDWANLSLVGNDEHELPEELLESLGFKGIRLKERENVESVYLFNQSDAEEVGLRKEAFAGPGEYLYHGTMKRNVPSIMRRGLKASRRGAEGPGVYLATTLEHAISWTKFVQSEDIEDLAFIRIRKDELEEMFGLYPKGEIQWDGADGDVLVGDADTVIPPELLEVIPIQKHAARGRSQEILKIFWEWQDTRDTKNPPVLPARKLLTLEPIARMEDEGIEIRLVLAVDKQLGEGDPQRAGTFIYKDLATGKETLGGYWMDWPEDESLRGWARYKTLPTKTRANLELSNQLGWGLRRNFDLHKTGSPDFMRFEEWVRSKGGVEGLMKLWSPESLEYYLSQATDDVKFDNQDKEEEELTDEIQERFHEYVMDELAREYDDWIYKYENLLQFPLRVYRAVTLTDVNSLETEGIGIYWTDSPSHAIAHWGGYKQGEAVYIIEGFVEEDAIDWDAMLEANMHPNLGKDEQEIRLKKGAKIILDGYRKDIKSFGAKGIFQPLEGEAVA